MIRFPCHRGRWTAPVAVELERAAQICEPDQNEEQADREV
jgi:hypothetical protein